MQIQLDARDQGNYQVPVASMQPPGVQMMVPPQGQAYLMQPQAQPVYGQQPGFPSQQQQQQVYYAPQPQPGFPAPQPGMQQAQAYGQPAGQHYSEHQPMYSVGLK